MKGPRSLSPLFPVLFACLPAACSGGDAAVATSGTSVVDVLVTDGPADDLSSFHARITSLRLVRPDGGTTAELLGGPVDLELLGLRGTSAWVTSAGVPDGTYAGARLVFAPSSYEARARDGAAVTVDATGDSLAVALPADVVLDGGYSRFVVDVDLDDSLSGDVASGHLVFEPRGSVRSSDGTGADEPIDELRGVVTSFDETAGTITLDAFLDDALSVPLGEVLVRVGEDTLLLGKGDAPLAGPAELFAALVPGRTVLEVHGRLGDASTVTARRIEVEGDRGGAGLGDRVEIEGVVVALDPGAGLELLIVEVEKGAAVAGPVLAGLGDPAAIAVKLEATTRFFLDDDDDPAAATTADALAVGQRIDVEFAAFLDEPFPAAVVEIEEANPRFDGVVTDVSGLPSTLVVHLDADDPAVLSGAVASSRTDVVVDLRQSTVVIDSDPRLRLDPRRIVAGLEVEVVGTLVGPPDAPTIEAKRTKVRAGELDGARVTGVDRASGSFTTVGGEIDEPLGGGTTRGPFRVTLVAGAVVEGDARDDAGLFGLFDSLPPGASLVVEVEGIGAGEPDEILAFLVDARVED